MHTTEGESLSKCSIAEIGWPDNIRISWVIRVALFLNKIIPRYSPSLLSFLRETSLELWQTRPGAEGSHHGSI